MGHRRGENRQHGALFSVMLDELVGKEALVRVVDAWVSSLDLKALGLALERECHRNVECMWLLGRLAPDHKTIAEFRRSNTPALVAACAAFVQFARTQRLIAGSTVAIDGSKIRAVASRKAV
jgi:hypothetical protein